MNEQTNCTLPDDAQAERADAWMAVVSALNEVAPGWLSPKGTGQDLAVAAIRQLAAAQSPEGGERAAGLLTEAMVELTAIADPCSISTGTEYKRRAGKALEALKALRAAQLAAADDEPIRPIDECYGDCPTNPASCPNPCRFDGRNRWQAAPAPAEGAVPSDADIEWPDIDGLAHSAAQEAYSFGISHDLFKRWMTSAMFKTASAIRAAIIAKQEDAPSDVQPKETRADVSLIREGNKPAPKGTSEYAEVDDKLLTGQAQHLIGALMSHDLLPGKTLPEDKYLKLWDVVKAQLRAVHREAVRAAQSPAPAPATGDTNGRRDGLRPAVHGRVPVGGYTPGALADLLFASRDVMSLNAELDLTMDQLVQLTQAVLTAVPSPAVGAPLLARAKAEWHEDDGPALWWAWNGHGWAGEAAWVGTPLDDDWPGYHTHWTAHPAQPTTKTQEGAQS